MATTEKTTSKPIHSIMATFQILFLVVQNLLPVHVKTTFSFTLCTFCKEQLIVTGVYTVRTEYAVRTRVFA